MSIEFDGEIFNFYIFYAMTNPSQNLASLCQIDVIDSLKHKVVWDVYDDVDERNPNISI